MTDTETMQEEADRLYAVLSDHYLPKMVVLEGFRDYSDASKNEVVARVARTYAPAPEGALLTRLLFIRTPENEADLRTVFLANLHAADPEARKYSLYGLQELGHEALSDLAWAAVRDTSNSVVTAALTILLPEVRSDSSRWAFLQGFYEAHRGEEAFHMSVSLLEAHGITAGVDE